MAASPSIPSFEHDDGPLTLMGWYDACRPTFIDLVGDYAGQELFLIEGDSLLRQCFSDERIDFVDGFQMLHAAYVVEQFLLDLIKRHCRFHVVFFKENAPLSVPAGTHPHLRSRYLLARAAILRHLDIHLNNSHPDVKVFAFQSHRDTNFTQYLDETQFHFIMSHDGASSSEEEYDTSAKIVLRRNIWAFNVEGFNVALINHVEFRDSKVFTMIIESSKGQGGSASQEAKLFRPETVEVEESLVASFKASTISDGSNDEVTTNDLSIHSLPSSYHCAVFGASQALKSRELDVSMVSAFLLHVILSKHLSLSQRRLALVKFDESREGQIDSFLAALSRTLIHIIQDPAAVQLLPDKGDSDIVDLIDGRLFRVILHAMSEGSIENCLPDPVLKDWERLSGFVEQLTEQRLSLGESAELDYKNKNSTSAQENPVNSKLAVLPFSNSVLNKHLESIDVATDSRGTNRTATQRETTHWHKYKKPLNPKYAAVQKVSKWKNPLRLNQLYMAEIVRYAASLTGSKGKALDPETITVGPKQLLNVSQEKAKITEKPKPQGKKGAPKKGTKSAVATLSASDQIKADYLQRKGDTETVKALSAWQIIMKNLEVVTDPQDRYLRTVDYLNGLDSSKGAILEAEVRLYMLQSLLAWWSKYCESNQKIQGYHVVALTWTNIRSIGSSSSITKEISQHVEKIAMSLGIQNAAADISTPAIDRKLSFKFTYPSQNLDIQIDQTEFQLKYCGPYMDRMLDAKPDPRVSSFTPDGWQRKVLDKLDGGKSIFVVAPTSAGKTFISFYAMEQILRADNDGVLVYVAPTKALVNQIAAEVQGRFSKRFPLPGRGVWAVHTRDYRINNSNGCQILITVPHILQTMLLSPSNAKSWAPRVRRIIFDEIHSIGQAEDGVVWEQLLLLAPCPIIALSATVGNPTQFNDWLTETQKSLGHEMEMIQHSTRYSDLRKYLYEPPSTFDFTGLGQSFGVGLGLDGLTGFEAFHPISSLVDKSRGMPDDLALEPRDCLSLWEAMVKHQVGEYKVPKSLDPSKTLPLCIRKADIFAWEKDLKVVLRHWMADRNSPFDEVVSELKLLDPSNSSSNNHPTTKGPKIDSNDLLNTTLPLLLQLHKRRALPAIFFNYDRTACEEIGSAVLKQLVAAESEWKKGSEWQKLITGYEKYLEVKELKLKSSAKAGKSQKKQGAPDDERASKTDRARDDASEGASFYDLFDPKAPVQDFSFANHKSLQKSELASYVDHLRYKNVKEDLIALLERGIGVHHAGMNRKYRQTVEMLFRAGFLRVIVATGTLSLGINMPCSTVVFSGDSLFLTALNFRQAAGRSGRRGFDLLGNVVFQGITRERASRLLSSRLPEMTGHFPVTTTLVLRMFTLLNDSKNSPYAINTINSLLSQPRLHLGGESFKEAVLHHLRFSIDYLRRNDLLGPRGEPLNFTSVVSQLYYTGNSSFTFHALLKGGYFHKLCTEINQAEASVLRELMLTLSHIFGRQYCKRAEDSVQIEKTQQSPSIVYLESMPETALEVLEQHNEETLNIFTTYVKTFASQHIKEEERCLPLTKILIGHNKSGGKPPAFVPTLQTPLARSPFVALSGHGDNFTSITDLCSSVRSGVFLESSIIPHLSIHSSDSLHPLNAYLLDFYTHGSLQALATDNGIGKADVWFLLNDFSMVLATICTSLASFLGLAGGEEETLGVGEEGEVNDDEKEAAAAEMESVYSASTNPLSTISSASSKQSTSTAKSGSKSKVVMESWDDDEEGDSDDGASDNDNVASGAQSDQEEYAQLMNVYKAFTKLKKEFDAKFRAIWA